MSDLLDPIYLDRQSRFRSATSVRPHASTIVAFAACGICAVLVGLLVGLGLIKPAFAFALLGLGAVAYFITFDSGKSLPAFWLLAPPLVLIALSLVLSRTNRDFFFVMEVLVIALSPYAIFRVPKELAASGFLKMAALLFIFYWFFALTSSYYGTSTLLSAIYQVFTNSKIFLLILIGTQLQWSNSFQIKFGRVVKYAWLPLVPFVLSQFLAPSAFDMLFPYAASHSSNPFGFPSRAVGFFRHSTFLGFYAMTFVILSVVLALYGRSKSFAFGACAYLAILLASGQRNELAVAIVTSFACWLFLGERRSFAIRATLLGVFGLSIFLSLVAISEISLIKWLLNTDIAGGFRATQPRAVVYIDAVDIASAYFPFGSGLGTFASAASINVNPTLYFLRGYTAFGWFGTNVLLDTFWAQHLAEPGVLGFVFFAALIALLYLKVALRVFASGTALPIISALAAFSFGAALLISPTSPALEDPGLIWIPALLLGLALRQAYEEKH